MDNAVTQAGVIDAIRGQVVPVKITYTGTLQTPLVFVTEQAAFIASGTGNGQATNLTAQSGAGYAFLTYVEIGGNPNSLTTLTLDNVVWTSGNAINLSGSAQFASLTTVSFPKLTHCGGMAFNLGGTAVAPALATLDYPELLYVKDYGVMLSSGLPALSAVSFPKLVTCGGTVANLYGATYNAITTLTFPALVTCSGVLLSMSGATLNNVASISCPALQYLGGAILNMAAGSLNGLTTLNFPSLVSCNGGYSISITTPALTTVTFGTVGTLKWWNGPVSFLGAALNAGSVNGLLQLFASLDGTNGTTRFGKPLAMNLNGGTCAAPTFTGTTKTTTAITVSAPDAYYVSASCSPDCSGQFYRNGSYNGQNRYTNEIGDCELWYDSGTTKWTISPAAGDKSTYYWQTAAAGAITSAMSANGYYRGLAASGAPTAAVSVLATATITSHGYSVGDYITVAGATPSGHNGTFKIASVTDANTVTYRIPSGTTIATVQATSVKRTAANEGYKYMQQILHRGATVSTN